MALMAGALIGSAVGGIFSAVGANQASKKYASAMNRHLAFERQKWGAQQARMQEMSSFMNMSSDRMGSAIGGLNTDSTWAGNEMSGQSLAAMGDWFGGQINRTHRGMAHSQRAHSAGLAQRQATATTGMVGQRGAMLLDYYKNLESRKEMANRYQQQMQFSQVGMGLQNQGQMISGYGAMVGNPAQSQFIPPSGQNTMSTLANYMPMLGMLGGGTYDKFATGASGARAGVSGARAGASAG